MRSGQWGEPGMSTHEDFIQLVAGLALDALEPADEQLVLAHLPTCEVCQRFLTEMNDVAAALAHDVPDSAPPAQLLDSLRAAVARTPQEVVPDGAHAGSTVSMPAGERHLGDGAGIAAARRGRLMRVPPRILTIAATVIALAAVIGFGGYALHARSQRDHSATALSSDQAVLAHLDKPGAYAVTLTSGGAATGAAVVDGRQVYLVAHDLGENDRSDSIYVLWARSGTGPMVAVGSFDVVRNGLTVVHAVLPVSVPKPAGFGVTHEAGRVAPATPGTAVLGSASST